MARRKTSAATRPTHTYAFPDFDGHTIGREVCDWMSANLESPGGTGPLILTDEQVTFILEFYRINVFGKRLYRRGTLVRPRGWGKSPLLAAIALAEAFGPVVPTADGPVARTRSLVQLAAATEAQTKNAWRPLLVMADSIPGVDINRTFVEMDNGRVRLEYVTAAARGLKGARPDFVVLDQTEQWTGSNGGHDLAEVIRINLGKTSGTSIESPNAYTPGEDSVAERSALAKDEAGHYYDTREPASVDMADKDSFLAALAIAYGDGIRFVDPERIWQESQDPTIPVERTKRDYLNMPTQNNDAFVIPAEWDSVALPDEIVDDGERIVLGFDGSMGRSTGKPDATALIGCRVSDGHLFVVDIWEAGGSTEWATWQPPYGEIEATVAAMFDRYKVAAFYGDPAAGWAGIFAHWDYKVERPASAASPYSFSPTRTIQYSEAAEGLTQALRAGYGISHDNNAKFTEHMLNGRARFDSLGRLSVGKDGGHSPRKVDAAVAAVMAWRARMDVLAKGEDLTFHTVRTATGWVSVDQHGRHYTPAQKREAIARQSGKEAPRGSGHIRRIH